MESFAQSLQLVVNTAPFIWQLSSVTQHTLAV